MASYELTVLLAPDLGEKELDKETKNLQGAFEKAGAKIKSKKDASKKPMAYEIGKFREAYYWFLELEIEPIEVKGIDDKLKLEDQVVRYLLVKKE